MNGRRVLPTSLQLLLLPILAASLLLAPPAVTLAGSSSQQADTDGPVAVANSCGTVQLNVRAGPGFSYAVLGRLPNGIGYRAMVRDATGRWLLLAGLDLQQRVGWVFAPCVDLSVPIDQLPVISLPAQSSARQVSPPEQPLTGQIAFPVFDRGRETYDVYLANADGTNMRRVISEASQPALSPDGLHLAFRHWKTDDRGIVVTNTGGGAALRVSDYLEDGLPAWSPDGKKLIFSSYRESDRRSRLYYLWADRKRDWVLTRPPESVYGEDPHWMPDWRIVYRQTRPTRELAFMNSDGSDPQTLLADETARAPVASPDGRQVVFMSQRDGNWEIYRIDTDGSDLQRLTQDGADDGLPTWSPDGRRLAFASNRGGQWHIWVMNADGTGQRPVIRLPGSLDGRVRFEPDYLNRGWLDEQISWGQ